MSDRIKLMRKAAFPEVVLSVQVSLQWKNHDFLSKNHDFCIKLTVLREFDTSESKADSGDARPTVLS